MLDFHHGFQGGKCFYSYSQWLECHPCLRIFTFLGIYGHFIPKFWGYSNFMLTGPSFVGEMFTISPHNSKLS